MLTLSLFCQYKPIDANNMAKIKAPGNQNIDKKSMIKAFKIYNGNEFNNWLTILIPENEFTDKLLQFKIAKYLYLGYQVELI